MHLFSISWSKLKAEFTLVFSFNAFTPGFKQHAQRESVELLRAWKPGMARPDGWLGICDMRAYRGRGYCDRRLPVCCMKHSILVAWRN